MPTKLTNQSKKFVFRWTRGGELLVQGDALYTKDNMESFESVVKLVASVCAAIELKCWTTLNTAQKNYF